MNTYHGQLLCSVFMMSTGTEQEHGHTNTRTHTHTPQTKRMTQKQQKQVSGRFERGMGTDIDTDTNTYRQRHEQRTSRHANTQNMSSALYTGKKQTTAIVPNSNIHVHRNAQINTQTGSDLYGHKCTQSVLIASQHPHTHTKDSVVPT